jgi:hypothetical protein
MAGKAHRYRYAAGTMRRLLLLLGSVVLVVSACTYESSGTTVEMTVADGGDSLPAIAPADIVFEDQFVEGSSVLVTSVTMPADGFVVLQSDEAGSPGEVIGLSAPLGEGIIANVPVPFFTPLLEEATVHATVHIDMDMDGLFDYEPPDGLIDVAAERDSGEVATCSADIDILAPLAPASVEVAEQTSDGRSLVVGSVDLPSSGFVVIQSDEDGEPGAILGVSDLLPAGESSDVEVELDPWLSSTEAIWAVVWVDRDRDGVATIEAEDTLDGVALTIGNEYALVQQTISVTAVYPVAIGVDDQESDGTEVEVALVTMPAAGFVEVLADDDGVPGARIGLSGLLRTGTSTNLTVELDEPLTEDGTVWVRVIIDYDGSGDVSQDDLQGFVSQDEEALSSLVLTVVEEDAGD